MDFSSQVLIRVRPLSGAEKSMFGYNRCLKQESAQCITWIGQPESRFTFDHIACETLDQVRVNSSAIQAANANQFNSWKLFISYILFR